MVTFTVIAAPPRNERAKTLLAARPEPFACSRSLSEPYRRATLAAGGRREITKAVNVVNPPEV